MRQGTSAAERSHSLRAAFFQKTGLADGSNGASRTCATQPEAAGFASLGEDVTELRSLRAEAARRESEERFRNMADISPLMIWVSGPDKGCTFVNKGWLSFTGRTLEEELGFGWTASFIRMIATAAWRRTRPPSTRALISKRNAARGVRTEIPLGTGQWGSTFHP